MVTVLRRRTHDRYEVQRASGVGGNRHLEGITTRVYTIAVGTVSQSLDERLDTSQSTVPVLEEPIGTTFTVNELDFTGIGRGIDQGGQENDSNGEGAAENHCGERGTVKVIHRLPAKHATIYTAAGGR